MELPEGWERRPLGELADLCLGKMLDKTKNQGRPYPYLRNLNVRWGHFDLSNLLEMRFEDHETERYSVQAGDVVVVEGGEPGRCAVWRGPDNIRIQKALHRVRCGPRLDPDYLAHHLRNDALSGELDAAFTGSTIKHLTGVALAAHELLLPPIEEQRRIVKRLDDLLGRARRAREALAEVPRILEQLRQSVLAAAFRGDLTAAWRQAHPDTEPASALLERVRAERRRRWEAANPRKKYVAPEPVDPEAEGLPELPAGWEWARLEELIEGFDAGRSPRSEGRAAVQGEYGVLKVSAVTWGVFKPDENKAMLPGDVPEPEITVRAGDLLISRANTWQLVGAVVLVAEDHPDRMLSDKTLRMRYLPGLDPTCLLHALRTRAVRDVFEADATGTSDSMRNLSQTKIASAPIPVLPASEQAVLASTLTERLSSIERAGASCQAQLSDLPRLEQSILSRAFRGELLTDPDPATR